MGSENSWLASTESGAFVVWDLNAGIERVRVPFEWAILDMWLHSQEQVIARQSGAILLLDPGDGHVVGEHRFPSRDNDVVSVSPSGR